MPEEIYIALIANLGLMVTQIVISLRTSSLSKYRLTSIEDKMIIIGELSRDVVAAQSTADQANIRIDDLINKNGGPQHAIERPTVQHP